MHKYAVMTNENTIEVAYGADVVLVCGTMETHGKVIKISASSAILTHGSTVFKAMLSKSHPFKEGNILSAGSQVTIPLPDDDPDTMVIVCKVMHLRFDMRSQDLCPETLLKMGILVDKYDAMIGMGVWPHYWISKQLATVTGQTRVKLLVASYMLKEAQMFQKLAYDLQMKCTMDIALGAEHEYPDVLHKVIAEINIARRSMAKRIASFLESTMVGEFTGHGTRPLCGSCEYLNKRGGAFVRLMSGTKLFPMTSMASRPLEDACRALRELPNTWYQGYGPCNHANVPACYHNYSVFPQEIMVGRLKAIADDTEHSALRICLDCVAGGGSFAPCQNGHPKWI